MRVERFQEENMQQAMAKVRAELGKDAVLISSRRVPGGIEVMAANDCDPAQLAAEIKKYSPRSQTAEKPKKQDILFEILSEKQEAAEGAPSLQDMQDELGRLRKLFEAELAQLAWRDAGSKQPNRMALLSRLESVGVTRDLSMRIVDRILPCADLELAWKRTLRILAKVVKTPVHDVMQDGGVISLVGPTGVGKTTTAAKIAAQFAERHGRNQVALITTDDFRIGGRDQLISLGISLGIPVQVVTNATDMRKTLDSFAQRRLVIIDTAGVNQRNEDLLKQYEEVVGNRELIKPYLVLSATVQESLINETISAYSGLGLSGAIVTKTDENVSIGAALSGLVRNRLAVAYLGTGQSIPEDLEVADGKFFADKLVATYDDSRRQAILRKTAAMQRRLATA